MTVTMAVLIVTHRRLEALRTALESIGRQRRRANQVIVSYPSTDVGTHQALPALAAQAGIEVTEVSVAARNVVAQENAGIQAARTDIVCFLDDDAIAPADWLERIEPHFRDASVGAVGGPDLLPTRSQTTAAVPIGHLDTVGRIFANHHRPHGDRVLEVDFLKGCNMSFRRELLVPLDTRLIGQIAYGFEIDMGLAARARGARVLYDPSLEVVHNSQHDMSAARPDLAFTTNHNHTYIVLKRVSWPRRALFLGYTFLLGDRSTAGLLRIGWMKLRHRWPLAACTAHMKGKVAGIKSFIDWRSAAAQWS